MHSKINRSAFSLSYLGFDLASSTGASSDHRIGPFGERTAGFFIQNPAPQWSCSEKIYQEAHGLFLQILQLLGEGYGMQKLDVFEREAFFSPEPEGVLQRSYQKHFAGRSFTAHSTYLLFFEHAYRKGSAVKFQKEIEKSFTEFSQKLEKIFLILKNAGLSPRHLMEKDFKSLETLLLAGKRHATPVRSTILSGSEDLKLGGLFVKVLPLVDTEKMELPEEIAPCSNVRALSKAAVDPFHFLLEPTESPLMVYNQILSLPLQGSLHRALDKKRRRHEGVSSSAPSNLLIAEEISELQKEIAREGTLLCEAHFSVLFSSESKESQQRTESWLESGFFQRGIILSKNAFNQMELFRAVFPGGALELKPYDTILSTLPAMLCFLFKEHLPKDESKGFALDFTSRQGKPLRIDFSDIPMQEGRIVNRNKFVLGPSGSGKSFLMNSIVEQYLRTNYDVLIIDTGDSYQGLCRYLGGLYVKYDESRPITMNPFQLEKEELSLEKLEFLSSLLYLIWKGADYAINSSEKSVLDALLSAYYELHYLRAEGLGEVSPEEIKRLYEKYYPFLGETAQGNSPSRNAKTYSGAKLLPPTHYAALGLQEGTSLKTLRAKFSRLKGEEVIKSWETAGSKQEIESALSVLLDPESKKAYDRSLKRLGSAAENLFASSEALEPKPALQMLLSRYSSEKLDFNSFFAFSEKFLPRYLKSGRFPIEESTFHQASFFLVLRDFYRGGKYEHTLNRAQDKSLFSERFIVFEIDAIKDNPRLFPIVTLIIMDTFIQKMRFRKNQRKALIIEEAWKAVASPLMAGYILYLYKTVRKFYGEAIVVTQELQDILSSEVVKESILSNSDTLVLLDQSKFEENFSRIAKLLNLSAAEQSKLFTVNRLDNKEGRGRFKEFYLKRGERGEVYGNEVSLLQYLIYTTEKPEKEALEFFALEAGNYQRGLDLFLYHLEQHSLEVKELVALCNLLQKVPGLDVVGRYKELKTIYPREDPLVLLKEELAPSKTNPA